MTIGNYTAVQNWADDQKWTDALLDAFVDDLETYINSTLLPKVGDITSATTVNGTWRFNGNNTHSGANIFSGNNLFSGNNTFSAANNFTATQAFAGATFSGNTSFAASLRLTTDLTGLIDNTGNELLLLDSVASAVNEITIANAATGNYPTISVTGGDTNSGLRFNAKGTGQHQFYDAGSHILFLVDGNGGGTPVNYMTANSAATLSAPGFTASGSDTDIGITLTPKGAGVVKSGARTLLREDGVNTKSYTGGNITIGTGTDGAYTDVDATNAAITFTVNAAGKYRVTCSVIESMVISAANFSSRVDYRLTDGTNNSPPVLENWAAVGGAATDTFTTNIFLDFVFTFSTTGSKTVKLQRLKGASTNVSSRTLLSDNTNTRGLYMTAIRVAD